jgi:hypothetical protein
VFVSIYAQKLLQISAKSLQNASVVVQNACKIIAALLFHACSNTSTNQ